MGVLEKLLVGGAIVWTVISAYVFYSFIHPEVHFKNIPPETPLIQNSWNENSSFQFFFFISPHVGINNIPSVKFGDSVEKKVTFDIIDQELNNRILVLNCIMQGEERESNPNSPGEKKANYRSFRMNLKKDVSRWKTNLNVLVVNDRTIYPLGYIPPDILYYMEIDEKEKVYSPILFITDAHLKSKDYITTEELLAMQKDNNTQLSITIKVQTVSLAHFRIFNLLILLVEMLENSGYSEQDIDKIKEVFLTIRLEKVVTEALLYVALDFLLFYLAVKSDISYWGGQKSMKGISRLTIAMMIILCIINLKLDAMNPSRINLGILLIILLVEIWKFLKVIHLQISWERVCLVIPYPRLLYLQDDNENNEATKNLDTDMTPYLIYGLVPFSFLYVIYNFKFEEYKDLYSWALDSYLIFFFDYLNFTYMLPQLFLNYRLKSAEGISMKSFMFYTIRRFLGNLQSGSNHGFLCLRCNWHYLLFLVFLYQWYIYPQQKLEERLPVFGPNTLDSKEEEKIPLLASM